MQIAATVFACALTLASAYVLYAEGTRTRRLEAQVQAAERHRDRLEAEIAVLKAERAFLSRPARIEPAARALGLRPQAASDIVTLEAIERTGSVAAADPGR
jgi:cell division protein FtsL